MGQIIELPDSLKLKQEIGELKNRLENLVLERDELQFVVCENVKMKYMLEIGSLEYKVYKTYCEFLRLRRKKEILQAKKNRQETFNMAEVDHILDEEFLNYKKKLDEKIHEMNQALERSKMRLLSKEETAELKKLYRSIVKSLHPDLNPNCSDAEKALFYNATDAYKQGDLSTLQIIFQMSETEENKEEASSSLIKLQKEKQRFQRLVSMVEAQIEEIKTKPPYIWKIYFEDERKKAERIAELEKQQKSFQEAIRTQQERINELMGNEK